LATVMGKANIMAVLEKSSWALQTHDDNLVFFHWLMVSED
jgi:hypothetical protein